jgi:hypothetical protein
LTTHTKYEFNETVHQFTKNTITDKKDLLKELKTIFTRGYSVDNIEHEQGFRCVGAPIRNYEGQVFAAISVKWPSQRLTLSRIPKIALAFERFGVHTCNWNIDPYIDAFRELPRLGYLDMGMESDLPRVKDTFGETRRAVIYWPTKLVDASLMEIRKDMDRVYRQLAPCDVVMADMQASTPDTRVIEFLKICNALESSNEV